MGERPAQAFGSEQPKSEHRDAAQVSLPEHTALRDAELPLPKRMSESRHVGPDRRRPGADREQVAARSGAQMESHEINVCRVVLAKGRPVRRSVHRDPRTAAGLHLDATRVLHDVPRRHHCPRANQETRSLLGFKTPATDYKLITEDENRERFGAFLPLYL